jgi:hypothetical protein
MRLQSNPKKSKKQKNSATPSATMARASMLWPRFFQFFIFQQCIEGRRAQVSGCVNSGGRRSGVAVTAAPALPAAALTKLAAM